ncbi:Fe-S cluster assembly protein SufD [Parapedobacter koreensis]|uniref:Iron-regulated ABC transporter permease protein SufD n=1 Tax=Parapedobacter koreensis TaxID=332977 RepID=A0A1H7QDQ5_9SPHI|nr:Fe-S cluster assembly protein SufD [Parapedobacter koreensis]SEL45645.1 Iron-regulated ABC transporter permease protein SufD [Parapedobacter koreensis]
MLDEVATDIMITQVSDSLYTQLIKTYGGNLPSSEPHSLDEIRKQAFERFKSTGFPTVKQEDWKYTNVQPLVNRQHYALDTETLSAAIAIDKAIIPGLDAYRVVMVDGKYNADLSTAKDIPGLSVMPIDQAFERLCFAKYFSEYADKTDNPFVALNTALFTSGLFIEVGKNCQLQKPVHVIHVASASKPSFTQVRNLYVMSTFAEAEIIESFITNEGAAHSLNNTVSEIVVRENAKLQHYYLQVAGSQGNYLNHTEVYQEKHSLYNNYNCSFPGAAFIRNNINVRLGDSEVESHLYGVTLTADNQLVDNHTIVDHRKPHCESYEWYKNITQDTSTAVFNGKIFVRPDAQKTNAFQQNNNMLIGEKSAVYTKPQLEIFADDVKCSHGCTIGQFDNEALFYLQARGISEAQARVLLVHAFAFDVTSRFANAIVREYVEHLVEQGLKAG